SIGYMVRDRAVERTERMARVASQVDLILQDVDRLAKEQKWLEALESVRRAEAAVASSEADPATTQRIHQRPKEPELLDRLGQIRMGGAALVDGLFDNSRMNQDYSQAFREYGVDVDVLPVETSINCLKTRPALAVPLAAALDDWVSVRRAVAATDIGAWK